MQLLDTSFQKTYLCRLTEKPQIESCDKIIMPPSALDHIASLHPWLFELRNDAARRVSHCGVFLEFSAEEGTISMPDWMMKNLLLKEGDAVRVKSVTLAKGTYVKLQPQKTDFLDISNWKAILEAALRNYSCLTTGDSIMVAFNNKEYDIDIVETKPYNAITIIPTDCEIDLKEPENHSIVETNAITSIPTDREIDLKEPENHSDKEYMDVGYLLELKENPEVPVHHWTSLISDAESAFAEDIDKLSVVFDVFLMVFPLWYEYWAKYIRHVHKLSDTPKVKVIEIYDRAVADAPYCTSLWIDYCQFAIQNLDRDNTESVFKRAIEYVGIDYSRSHELCNMFFKFDEGKKELWLAENEKDSDLYFHIEALRFPSRELKEYHDRFMRRSQNKLKHASGRQRNFLSTSVTKAKELYNKSSELTVKVSEFEDRIRMTDFSVKSLNDDELANWHKYLSKAEEYAEKDKAQRGWVLSLYERCLIPCANYPDFWMRYVYFAQSIGKSDIASSALDRAVMIHHSANNVIVTMNEMFRELTRNEQYCRAVFLNQDTDSLDNLVMRSNMARRMLIAELFEGKGSDVCAIYESAREEAKDDKGMLTFHLSQLQHTIYENTGDAVNTLTQFLMDQPYCKVVILELIERNMRYKKRRNIKLLDRYVSKALENVPSNTLDVNEREEISEKYFRCVDMCGEAEDVWEAFNRHIRLFPHLIRRKLYEQ